MGSDGVFGLAGNDTINGGDDQDFLYGNSGDDTLNGDDGNDSLFGGFGNDALFGGEGADTLSGEEGVDVIFGGAGDDNISGGIGDDTINGDAGRDSIFAGEGNDQINGGSDVDFIFGGAGNDVIDGGTGNDQLRGQDGSDVFVFNLGNGNDIVHDFIQGVDTLSLLQGSAFDSFAEIMAATSQSGNNALINLTGGNFITLVNIDIADLTAADFGLSSSGQKEIDDGTVFGQSTDQFVFAENDMPVIENDLDISIKENVSLVFQAAETAEVYSEDASMNEWVEYASPFDQIDYAF